VPARENVQENPLEKNFVHQAEFKADKIQNAHENPRKNEKQNKSGCGISLQKISVVFFQVRNRSKNVQKIAQSSEFFSNWKK
jgi:hypothetical protein